MDFIHFMQEALFNLDRYSWFYTPDDGFFVCDPDRGLISKDVAGSFPLRIKDNTSVAVSPAQLTSVTDHLAMLDPPQAAAFFKEFHAVQKAFLAAKIQFFRDGYIAWKAGQEAKPPFGRQMQELEQEMISAKNSMWAFEQVKRCVRKLDFIRSAFSAEVTRLNESDGTRYKRTRFGYLELVLNQILHRDSRTTTPARLSGCWQCYGRVNENDNQSCRYCGWFICNRCASWIMPCGCGFVLKMASEINFELNVYGQYLTEGRTTKFAGFMPGDNEIPF
jgi:hypothetical protein